MSIFTEMEIQEYAYNKKIDELNDQNMDELNDQNMDEWATSEELRQQKTELEDTALDLIAQNTILKGHLTTLRERFIVEMTDSMNSMKEFLQELKNDSHNSKEARSNQELAGQERSSPVIENIPGQQINP